MEKYKILPSEQRGNLGGLNVDVSTPTLTRATCKFSDTPCYRKIRSKDYASPWELIRTVVARDYASITVDDQVLNGNALETCTIVGNLEVLQRPGNFCDINFAIDRESSIRMFLFVRSVSGVPKFVPREIPGLKLSPRS